MVIKKSLFLVIFIFILLWFSCERTDTSKDLTYEAEVIGPNVDCGEIQLKFTKNLDKVVEIAGPSAAKGNYIARNLPVELKVPGLIISLNCRKAEDSELGYCTAWGPGLPWVYVTYAKIK